LSSWIIESGVFSNWNTSSLNCYVTDQQPVPILSIISGKNAYFRFNENGALIKNIKDFRFLLRFPPNISNINIDVNFSGLWYYNIQVEWINENNVVFVEGFTSVMKTKITGSISVLVNTIVYIVSIEDNIKQLNFSYTVGAGSPKWIAILCPL